MTDTTTPFDPADAAWSARGPEAMGSQELRDRLALETAGWGPEDPWRQR